MEWSKYNEADLLRKSEYEFFIIYHRCQERQEAHLQWMKEQQKADG